MVLGVALTIVFWRRSVAAYKVKEAAQKAAAEQARLEEAAERSRVALAAQEAMLQREAEKKREAEEVRRRDLVDRFGEEIAGKILKGALWQGATTAMMEEMLGQPVDVDETVLKTKTKTTYKYRQIGTRQFRLRVFFENSICTGWELKD